MANSKSATHGVAALHSKSGFARFFKADKSVPVSKEFNASNPGKAAADYAATYLSSRKDGFFKSADFKPRRKRTSNGVHTVRLKQYYQGLPVYGAEIIVRMNKTGKLLSMQGEIVPLNTAHNIPDANSKNPFERMAATLVSGEVHDLENIDLSATIDKTAATLMVRDYIAMESGVNNRDIKTGEPELMIYNPALLQTVGSNNKLVWNIPVSSTNEALLLSEEIKIDAHTGDIVHRVSHIHEARNRVIFDSNNIVNRLPGAGPFRNETSGVSGLPAVDLVFDYLGDTYDYYSTNHSRDSYDNAGVSIWATVRHCRTIFGCPMENAYWDPSEFQLAFGDGFIADDITAHEYTHAITSLESGLRYEYQAGAINESLSDIWGEFVDLDNASGDDSAAVKWQIGEDLPTGAGRSMKTPLVDKIIDTDYACSTDATPNQGNDYGGVHTNSGVNNKAVYLMTDGGSFNGQTISGIGRDKVAKIYYEAQTNLLTPSSNYYSLFKKVKQACNNLKGSHGISTSNCTQVENALLAVNMDQIPCTLPTMFINGDTGMVNVNSALSANLSVSLEMTTNASADPYPNADYFVAFYLEDQDTWYSLNQEFQWTIASSAAYQGPLVSFHGFPLPKIPFLLPSGTTIPVYFLVDLHPDNIFNNPYRYSMVMLHIN